MIQIGKFNELEVKSKAPVGLYLTDGREDILLPKRYVPKQAEAGDILEVFVYLDNEDRPVATTLKPYALVDDFVFLEVKEVNEHGAFLNWGISKDLFVSYAEQRFPLQVGNEYLVYVFMDKVSRRIAATTRWSHFIDREISDLKEGEQVEILIAEQTDLGFKAIIDNQYEGLLYKNEVFEPLEPGDFRTAFIRHIREDGKIDLRLQQEGYGHVKDMKEVLLLALKENQGALPLGDKSSPGDIYSRLNISKKVFKKTVGGLYKDKLITITDYEIKLVGKKN
jgi:predicted RNA-binding protein (virulence factor B family)